MKGAWKQTDSEGKSKLPGSKDRKLYKVSISSEFRLRLPAVCMVRSSGKGTTLWKSKVRIAYPRREQGKPTKGGTT